MNPNDSIFYDSLSYDSTIILKFFREKFSILSSIFFSDEILIENILSKRLSEKGLNSENFDMDICFETYINKTYLLSHSQSNTEENLNLTPNISDDKIHSRTKIEILNILSFLLNTYTDVEIINHDISKFICDLMETLVERRESCIILENISNIFKILLKNYKKNCLESNINSSPVKIIFCELIKHILNKLIIQTQSTSNNDVEVEIKNKYYEYFKEFYHYLKSDENKSQNNKSISDMTNMIIFSVKELVYKNVDNQSFKNPISL